MELLDYINQFHEISLKDYELLINAFQPKSFKKGEFAIREGQIQKELFFIQEGIQMSYFDTGDKRHVMAFTYPPDISAVPESFLLQKPSAYYIQCLTDTRLNCISYTKLQLLFDKSQSLERLFRKMTEFVLIGMINRHIERHSMTMEERFKNFAKRSFHLLQTVPHKYIASYLDIDPTNFSKLFNSVKI